MNKYYKQFLVDSERVSFDLKHRKTIKFNMSKYDAAVEKGFLRYKNKEKVLLIKNVRLLVNWMNRYWNLKKMLPIMELVFIGQLTEKKVLI